MLDDRVSEGSPAVSALIATYRRRDLLSRAVRSVLAQTVTDLELIVVDDEPSDETRTLVEAIGDRRVEYVAHERNRGLAAARNTGIAHARGRWVAFLDDDDEWAPTKLHHQLEAMHEHRGNAVVSCHERWIRRDGSSRLRTIDLNGDVHGVLLATDMVLMQMLLVPRSAFDEVGLFDERLTNYMDMDMSIRLSRRYPFVTIPEPLFIGHETAGSLSRNERGRIRSLELILDKYPEYRNDRRLRSRWIYRIARKYGSMNDRRAWREKLWEALRLHPTHVRAWAMLLAGLVAGPSVHEKLSAQWSRLLWATRRVKARIGAAR